MKFEFRQPSYTLFVFLSTFSDSNFHQSIQDEVLVYGPTLEGVGFYTCTDASLRVPRFIPEIHISLASQHVPRYSAETQIQCVSPLVVSRYSVETQLPCASPLVVSQIPTVDSSIIANFSTIDKHNFCADYVNEKVRNFDMNKMTNIWVVGDACGRFRGTVAAMVSGAYAASQIPE